MTSSHDPSTATDAAPDGAPDATPGEVAVRATAILGGGCFWCLEAVFRELEGVERVESGYAGGTVPDPSYEDVCTGRTGHAEVVRLTFDPRVLSYADLLRVFFAVHDPTTRDRQGNDIGPQYRSVIFCDGDAQRQAAGRVIAELAAQRLWDGPVVTAIEGPAPFYAAEDYHRDYFTHNGSAPYCTYVVAPKVAKFRKAFANRLKRGG
jgi:peptide-methionine (S)-S-oxide reductase